ncbi:MAG: hypothetical protein CVU57_10285 [Deltaproteobacteria bacterium HGW-Deltaproteobacteria-15]|nr:MAG: hypothetical protein CVU57_10285 [Deltaproteobacteria bacterium HGW-Deltaproteobacteria-15]
MFQLSAGEFENLKSQFVTSSWGGMRKDIHPVPFNKGLADRRLGKSRMPAQCKKKPISLTM